LFYKVHGSSDVKVLKLVLFRFKTALHIKELLSDVDGRQHLICGSLSLLGQERRVKFPLCFKNELERKPKVMVNLVVVVMGS